MNKDLYLKKCNICNLSKSIEHFKGRYKSCRECINKKRREANLKKDSYRLKNNKLDSSKEKLCKYCDIVYNINNFRKNRLKCKDCEKKYCKEYRKSDIGKAKQKEWHESNLEKHKNLQAIWYQNNKNLINEKNKIKLINNPILKMIYRRRLNLIIKKNASTLTYINCSQEFLLKYIDNYLELFPNLTLENYGTEWHIDHVIPISKLDLSNKNNLWCLEWFNLAPLLSKENLEKNNSIDKKQINKHINFVNNFIKLYNINNIKLDIIATYLN